MSERKPGRDRIWKRRFQHGWERARQQYVPSTIISKFELFRFNHLQMWTREAWMAMTWRDLATLSIGVATERMPTRWSISSEDTFKILLKAHSRWMTLFVERKGKSRSVTWGEIVLALLQQFVTVTTTITTTNTTTTTITINHHHNYHQSPCLGIRALWVEASPWWSTRRGWWEPLLLFPKLRNYFFPGAFGGPGPREELQL